MKYSLIPALILTASTAFACSNVLVSANGFSAVARSMDFSIDTGNTFGFSHKGEPNQAYLNLNQGQKIKKARWQTRYNYLGQTWRGGSELIDGINEQGVYCGALYLPGFTQYPAYNPNNPRPALGTFSLCNYVLANADSTASALKALRKVQLIKGGAAVDPQHLPGIYAIAPLHYVIRDRQGHSAVIEFTHGKTRIYTAAGPVLTNAPTYTWQVKNAARYDYTSPKTINLKMDGSYMSGSGYTGLPGDWMSPSRFARATQLLKHMPAPHSDSDALSAVWSVLQSVTAPLGGSPSPTLWETVADLNQARYCLKVLHHLTMDAKNPVSSIDPTQNWQCYQLDQLNKNSIPKKFVDASLNRPQAKMVHLIDLMHATAGPDTKRPSLATIFKKLVRQKSQAN